MKTIINISSEENTFFKLLKKIMLGDRRKEEFFAAEGSKFLKLPKMPEYIFLLDTFSDRYLPFIFEKFANIPILILTEKLFDKVSSQQNSQGVILAYKAENKDIASLKGDIVIFDRIQDPGNLGAICRTVEAVGIKNIISLKGTVDHYSPKVVRSSMGNIISLNIFSMDEPDAIEFLKLNNYNVITTDGDSYDLLYNKVPLKANNAIIFGNEGEGISNELKKISNVTLGIPIFGTAESLNVSVAAGIILYKIKEIESAF